MSHASSTEMLAQLYAELGPQVYSYGSRREVVCSSCGLGYVQGATAFNKVRHSMNCRMRAIERHLHRLGYALPHADPQELGRNS